MPVMSAPLTVPLALTLTTQRKSTGMLGTDVYTCTLNAFTVSTHQPSSEDAASTRNRRHADT
jgi:hypothetical protein